MHAHKKTCLKWCIQELKCIAPWLYFHLEQEFSLASFFFSTLALHPTFMKTYVDSFPVIIYGKCWYSFINPHFRKNRSSESALIKNSKKFKPEKSFDDAFSFRQALTNKKGLFIGSRMKRDFSRLILESVLHFRRVVGFPKDFSKKKKNSGKFLNWFTQKSHSYFLECTALRKSDAYEIPPRRIPQSDQFSASFLFLAWDSQIRKFFQDWQSCCRVWEHFTWIKMGSLKCGPDIGCTLHPRREPILDLTGISDVEKPICRMRHGLTHFCIRPWFNSIMIPAPVTTEDCTRTKCLSIVNKGTKKVDIQQPQNNSQKSQELFPYLYVK